MTVTGPHRPEVVEQLFTALAGRDGTGAAGELTEVAQAILRGRLVLVAAVRPLRTGPGEQDALLARLVRTAAALSAATGVQVDVEATETAPSTAVDRGRARVTILGSPVPLEAVAGAVQAVRAAGGWVDTIATSSNDPVTGVELVACGAPRSLLCPALARVAAATDVDVAVS
ncbi:hypothetical protein [Geodermatophilus sp. URMC 64]